MISAPTTIDSSAFAEPPSVAAGGALGGIDVHRAVGRTRIACRSNCALSPSALGFALALPAVISLVIAVGFYALGFTWIVPFGGAEAALLAAAFCWIARRAGDGQIVTVTRRAVEIETTIDGRSATLDLGRTGLRVEPRRDGTVTLKGRNDEITVGRHLGFGDRRQLLPALRAALREHDPSSAGISVE